MADTPPSIPISEQIAAVERARKWAIREDMPAALDAAIQTLKRIEVADVASIPKRGIVSPLDLVKLLASIYHDRPRDERISIGHWTKPPGDDLPRFYADIGITVGELSDMAKDQQADIAIIPREGKVR